MGIRFILLGCANVSGSAWYFLRTRQIRAVVNEKLTQGPILIDQSGHGIRTVLGRKTLGAYKKCLAEKSVDRPDRRCTFYKAAKEPVSAYGDAAGLKVQLIGCLASTLREKQSRVNRIWDLLFAARTLTSFRTVIS